MTFDAFFRERFPFLSQLANDADEQAITSRAIARVTWHAAISKQVLERPVNMGYDSRVDGYK